MAVAGHLVPALAAPIPGIPGVLGAGREVLVGYNIVPVEWHARLLIAWIEADWWIIVTPEGDVYAEMISLSNQDLVGFRVRPVDLTLPMGIDPNSVHDFQHRPDPVALGRLLEEGVVHSNVERA